MFNPIQKAPPPTSFSSVTSANIEISPKIFLTFSFNPFVRLMLMFHSRPYLV